MKELTPHQINEIVKLKEVAKIPGSKILRILTGNQFSKGSFEQFSWQYSFLTIPNGADLSLVYIPGSEKNGVEKRKIIISKRDYFDIEIKIEPGFGSGPSQTNDIKKWVSWIFGRIESINSY